MLENIEKIETSESTVEKNKEVQNNILNSEIIKEDNESSKQELLKEIHDKEVSVEEKNKSQPLNDEGGKISSVVKQFYSFGVKAIEKVRKSLGAYDLDKLHDEITNKNKKQ
ncbi:hypothetical protein M0Q50_04685 [bacterium]|jgi:hypothetical protein|nr:hypothetical protein [bacterium]